MKSHMLLLRTVLEESGTRCCTSTSRDWKTITTRTENEGLSFLTIALPKFCDDLQKGLSRGSVDSSLFVGYAKKGYLPRFLLGFTSRVFNSSTGLLVNEPCYDAIHSLRQICLLFGKVNLPCSDTRTNAAFAQYVDCEKQVRLADQRIEPFLLKRFSSMALRVLGDVMSSVDREIYEGEIVPKHGPGATADRLTGNGKYNLNTWTRRLDEVFPSEEFLFPSWNPLVDSPLEVLLEPEAEIPVKVITVPKTLKTPRIIAIEPACMMYAQQGIMRSLVQAIERDDILSKLIGFDDQNPNREMAYIGSRDGSLATLDLREASDRVSNQLVRRLSYHFPWFSKGLDASRSRKADVPGYGVIRLAKFASMGSALCFPIEAMVFLTIVLMGIERGSNSQITRERLKSFIGKVRIFGDDIIVPEEYVQHVVEELETFGLLVNFDKSFWTGKFRESCGKEYFNGEDVSIVRVREMLPSQRGHVREIISAVSLRNQFYFSGYWETAAMLDKLLGGIIPFPMVLPESPALGRHSFLGYDDTQKECSNLQKPLVRAYVERSTKPLSYLDGRGALLKYFLNSSDLPVTDRNHLERAGRPKTVNIKLGWVSAT